MGLPNCYRCGNQPCTCADGCTIYNADCLTILHGLSGIGAVVTDPPYSSGGMFRGDRAQPTVAKYVQGGTLAYRPDFAGDNRDQRSFMLWCWVWLSATRQCCVSGAPITVFSDWRQLPTITDAIQCTGWTWRNLATWWKPGIRMQRGRFSSSAEYIIYGSNGPVTDGMASPQNVFQSPVARDKVHIAEKPLDVMRWVLGVVPEGATILDPFAGSGATLAAAKDLGCKSVGIEVDERYCEIAARRLEQGVLF